MEAEDMIELPSCRGDTDNGDHEDEVDKLGAEDGELGILPEDFVEQNMEEIEEGQLISKTTKISGDFVETTETRISGYVGLRSENDDCQVEGQLVSALVSDEIAAAEVERKNVDMPPENCGVIEREKPDIGSISGAKRMRMTYDEQQPSVLVKYYSLSRQSKQKLEELLREWSEWHVRNSSGTQNQKGGSETGEGMYFPALDIGAEKASAVSFWMENETRKPVDGDFVPVEDASVPLYDRGFALGLISADGSSNMEGGSELLDAPRCFNCGSYNHSLKECSKPRDNVAVNNSRMQLKAKRNQTAGLRNPIRYYQDSPGGKYEGLRPGVLDTETRRLLGLGEFDPPPWLNRMREIGYPPGYLEPEDDNVPSGITIYANEDIKKEGDEDIKEEGEIFEPQRADPPKKKMSVSFPGMNAPIPNNADERTWAARSSNSDRNQNGDSFHSKHSSESYSRGFHRDRNYRDFNDDDGPFDRGSRYTPRYGDYDFNSPSRSSRKNGPAPRSPSFGRPSGDSDRDRDRDRDRGRNDPLDSEDSAASRLYSSYSYNSSRRFSEHNTDSDGIRGDQLDHSLRGRGRDDKYHNRSGR